MDRTRVLAVVAAVCAVAYGVLLAGVAMDAGWVHGLDGAVQAAVFPLRSDALTPLMAFTTDLSDTVPCVVVAALFTLYLMAKRQLRPAGIYVGALVASEVVIEATKFLLGRERPVGMNLIEFPWNASFPSGHTFGAIVAVGLAVFLLEKLNPQWPRGAKTALATAAVLWVLYIGFTRIYLGVHWPSDVLGSMLLCGGVVIPVAAIIWQRVMPAASSNSATDACAPNPE